MKAINKEKFNKALKGRLAPICALIIAALVLLTALPYSVNAIRTRNELPESSFEERGRADRIHFIGFENTDCVLIESNNRFALFYGGAFESAEKEKAEGISIADYLKLRAADGSGRVLLDYLICADSSYEKIEGLKSLIKDKGIYAKTIYFKRLDFSAVKMDDELKETYYKVYEAILEKGTPIAPDSEEMLTLGDYKLHIIDAGDISDSSLNLLIKKGDLSVFIAGNINSKDMKRLKNEIGEVTLYKAPFAGGKKDFPLSVAMKLKPDYIVFGGKPLGFGPALMYRLCFAAGGSVYETYKEGGIVADLSTDEIRLCKIGQLGKIADSTTAAETESSAK